MFKIGVQTGGLERLYDLDTAYRVVRESGFDAVDANLDHLFPVPDIHNRLVCPALEGTEEEILAAFKPWKDAAEKHGIENYQAHAPFPSLVYDPDGSYNDYLIGMLEKIIMGCDYIGCHKLVVHPFFLPYDHQVSPEKEWETNIASYSRLIPAAKKYGVKILLENMFTRNNGRVFAACCSDITTACRYIDTLNDIAGEKVFGFCLDTGHLLLLGLDIKNAMVELGDRIEAFHVHDNDGLMDQHLAPYMGIMDWKRFVEGLKEIGFKQTVCFETFNIFNRVDPELSPTMLRFIADAGRMFARRAGE